MTTTTAERTTEKTVTGIKVLSGYRIGNEPERLLLSVPDIDGSSREALVIVAEGNGELYVVHEMTYADRHIIPRLKNSQPGVKIRVCRHIGQTLDHHELGNYSRARFFIGDSHGGRW